jgi:hypothetical protein
MQKMEHKLNGNSSRDIKKARKLNGFAALNAKKVYAEKTVTIR